MSDPTNVKYSGFHPCANGIIRSLRPTAQRTNPTPNFQDLSQEPPRNFGRLGWVFGSLQLRVLTDSSSHGDDRVTVLSDRSRHWLCVLSIYTEQSEARGTPHSPVLGSPTVSPSWAPSRSEPQGSFPCSSWEIRSGLDPGTPARGEMGELKRYGTLGFPPQG